MDRVPVLKVGHLLLVTIQVDMEDTMALALEEDLAEAIAMHGSHGVLIDVSGLDVVDTFIGRALAHMASVAKVLGARTVVVGIRPAVAITLVELGLSLGDAATALTVERGMEILERLVGSGRKVLSSTELPRETRLGFDAVE
jgi:rsbT antagonist protein RsbS